jgi:hypothetical protein
MLELCFVVWFWIVVYALEALHDINYKTINGIEKFYDGGMFAVLHIGFGLVIWFYTSFGFSFSLTVLGLLVRWNFHDGLIMVFRGLNWFHLPTVDNENDVFDAIYVKLGTILIWLKMLLLAGAIVVHHVTFIN